MLPAVYGHESRNNWRNAVDKGSILSNGPVGSKGISCFTGVPRCLGRQQGRRQGGREAGQHNSKR